MNFQVAAEAYDAFMGRYSSSLSPQMLALAAPAPGHRAIDVGCGPGALTGALVAELGAEAVAALDPSEPFVRAARERHPGTRVLQATAEAIPFDDDSFDHAFAQLVVHFMADPVAGLREMRRVTRPGGRLVACVWDFAGDRAPLSTFWRAARALDPAAQDESRLAGAAAGDLERLFTEAGLTELHSAELEVRTRHSSFEEWWQPYTRGVGPAGAYAAALPAQHLAELQEQCRRMLPPGPFELASVAWAVRAVA